MDLRQLWQVVRAEGITPVPISNTTVKPSSPDDTARAASWESRTLPALFGLSDPSYFSPNKGNRTSIVRIRNLDN